VTELDAGLVRRKLAVIVRNLGDLAAVEGLSLGEYRRDRFRQKGVERLLQETVEAAVDVNLHLLRLRGGAVATDYFTSFTELGRQGVIPPELANQLAPSAGMRNRLVHQYDAIDDAVVLGAVGDARRLFAAYVAAVERFVTAEER
jgi:uncharacterized protein YutE (UPF0331/DUF86 family)